MTDSDFPRFLSDAKGGRLLEEPLDEGTARAFERISELLPDTVPSPASLDRLMNAVDTPGERFAPFFGRIADLFDLSDDAVRAVFIRAGEPASWRFAGLPGVRVFDVKGGPRVQGAEALLVRFAAGKRFPEHRHGGAERLLLLEGGYEDDRGARYHAGDDHHMACGTTHAFRIFPDGPCIGAALYQGGLVFTSFGLRLLAKVVGR